MSKQFRSMAFLTVFGSALLCLAQPLLAQDVPPPANQIADRIGIYAWGYEPSAYQPGPQGLDRLNWAADKVAQIGSRTLRLTLPGAIYGLPASADLAQTAAHAAYDRLFSDGRFKTYLLTTTTTGAFIDTEYVWTDGLTQVEYDATRDEIAKLGETLLGNARYAGKSFIIMNWEADNELLLYYDKASIWDAYTRWIEARAEGVRLARQRVPNSAARLYSGLEFNQIRTRYPGVLCGALAAAGEDPLKYRCVVDYVAPRVSVDYYSFSCWQMMDIKITDGPNGSYKNALKRDLGFALARVRERRPEIQERNFIVGEFGIHRTFWGEKTVANFANEFMDAVTAADGFQASYAIWWQIVDNLQFNIVWEEGFGLFRSRNGLFYLNLVGDTFKRKLAGQAIQPLTGGPGLRRDPPGFVNVATGEQTFELNPLSRFYVFADNPAAPFTPSGNRVIFEQMLNTFLLDKSSAPEWAESATQITSVLPKGLRPGGAFAQVLDSNGVESRAQFFTFQCNGCPAITDIIDSERALNEFHPGTPVTITGTNFSLTGNSVAVEQQDLFGRKYRAVVAANDVLQPLATGAPTELRLRLPRDLIATKFTVVIVTNAAGLESNMYPLRDFPHPGIVPECPACAPVISVRRGVTTRDEVSTNLLPGAAVAIAGDRFAPSGNSVIVEQLGRRFTLARDGEWTESATRITAALPLELAPGAATLYVVNAQGRESKAVNLLIARSLGAPRTPLRRPAGNRGIQGRQ